MTNNELCHFGIKGQKWGERRFQNEDGTLTIAGKERYSSDRGLRSMQRQSPTREVSISKVSRRYAGNNTAKPISTVDGKPVYEFKPKAAQKTDREKINTTRALVNDAKTMISSGRLSKSNFEADTDDDFRVYIEEITGQNSDEYSDEDITQMREEFNRALGITKKDQEKATDEMLDRVADEVIAGKYGNGEERKKKLGKDYEEIQKRVNKKLSHSFTYSNELYHFGIKGQKWGVRRFQNEDGTRTSLGRERRRGNRLARAASKKKSDYKAYRKRIKRIDKMSDEEIANRIKRLESEAKLKDLERQKMIPGGKAVADILSSSGKNAATKIVTAGMTVVGLAVVTKMFGPEMSQKVDRYIKKK